MRLRHLPALALALAAAACATVPRLSAANDIHAFLVAVRDGDRARFDAHVDRGALKTQLRSRVLGETARANGTGSWATLGAALAGPLVDVAVDALVQPAVFRAEAVRLGYDPARPIPSTLALASLVRPVGDGRRPSPGLIRPGRQPGTIARRRARTARLSGVGTPWRSPAPTTAPVRYSCSRGRPASRS